MNLNLLLAAAATAALALAGTTVATLSQTAAPPSGAGQLRAAADFVGIADTQQRSIALFEEAGKVLQHPRCLNCHPAGDRPFQGDAMRPHQPLVVRGKDGHGAPALACTTCHGGANFDPARVPGDPHWHLAPASMAWQGKSLGYICNQLKDPKRNGNRNMEAILKHVVTDSLVKWAWNPGPGRTPVPGTNETFGALLRAWAEAGGHCPPP